MSSVSPSVESGKRTRFYRQAENAATRILEAFKAGNLPKALAPVFVNRRDNVPCRAWSWSNQLLAALSGHSDARGYRQWQRVGRHVKKRPESLSHSRSNDRKEGWNRPRDRGGRSIRSSAASRLHPSSASARPTAIHCPRPIRP